jgi:hypothetical protein
MILTYACFCHDLFVLQRLPVLRMRTHATVLRWDDRYAPYLARAGLHDLARVVNAGLLDLDAPLLTAFVDRWRPETHTFHVPCGEMMVTLQDVAIILGLPLEGVPVSGILNFAVWPGLIAQTFGIVLPERPDGDRRT